MEFALKKEALHDRFQILEPHLVFRDFQKHSSTTPGRPYRHPQEL
jgi:hypothetical protein